MYISLTDFIGKIGRGTWRTNYLTSYGANFKAAILVSENANQIETEILAWARENGHLKGKSEVLNIPVVKGDTIDACTNR